MAVKKTGRPVKMTPDKIDLLEKLCRMKPTLEDCSEILSVDKSTIEKWIKRTHGESFSVFRDKKMAHTRFMIVREMLEQCKKGNMTALIFASKNLCGWSDNNHIVSETKQEIKLSYTIDE